MTEEEKRSFWQKAKEGIGDFIYGMASHEATRQALKTRGSMEHLFILITMGDLLGIPILPPYYSLRLLPYVVPQISTWKTPGHSFVRTRPPGGLRCSWVALRR